jgi:WD40 repeat protein
MDNESSVENSNVQAEGNSIATGNVSFGGSVHGSVIFGSHNVVGFTSEQVSALIAQISTSFDPKPYKGPCPYRGLEFFREKDAELFFGREKLVEDLIGRVKESEAIFITGSSGSGKSSLVRAGLIPALKKAGPSKDWLYVTMKPGRDPMEGMAVAFSRLTQNPETGDYVRKHSSSFAILHQLAESLLTDDEDQRLVLFVDQFEEIFTQVNRDQAKLIIDLLAHTAMAENGRVILFFSLRSDFVPNCQIYSSLNTLLSQKYAFLSVGAMQPEELVRAIALPAHQVGLRIDPALVAQIINDMHREPGALPLMQFALKDLFDSQKSQNGEVTDLNLKDYLDRGGIHKALELHADKTFETLNSEEQSLARSVFSGLIEIGRGTQDTGRTAFFSELVSSGVRSEAVQVVIRKLADARLVTTSTAESNGQTTVALSHEKLISSWTWLKKLVDENRDAIAVQNEIINDAKEWDENQRDDSFLYRGARLANAREKLAAKQLNLSGLAMEFIEAGEKAYTDVLELEKKRANHLEELNRTALARQLTAQALSIIATQSSKQTTAILLAVQSMKLAPSVEARGVLINSNLAADPIAHMTHDDDVLSITFSLDNEEVIEWRTGKENGSWEFAAGKEIARTPVTTPRCIIQKEYWEGREQIIDLLAVATGKITRITIYVEGPEQEGGATPPILSPDGRYVASASVRPKWGLGTYPVFSATVWNANTGAQIGGIAGSDRINIVEFDQHSKYMAAGDRDNITVIELATGNKVTKIPYNVWKNSIIKSPDGRYMISKEDKFFVLHELFQKDGKVIARVEQDDEITCVAISEDGKYLISGSKDGIARVCEVSTGREVARMTHVSEVTSVAFGPTGKYVASASEEIIIVWKPEKGNDMVLSRPLIDSYGLITPDHVYAYEVQLGNVHRTTSATFNLDNKYVIFWEAEKISVKEIGTFIDSPPITKFKMNERPDEMYRIVVAENAARVLDVNDQEVAHMTHAGNVTRAIFSPDGKYVISGDENTVLAWMWHAEKMIAVTCALMPRNLTRAEWAQYIGDALPYQAVCENLPIEPEEATTETP